MVLLALHQFILSYTISFHPVLYIFVYYTSVHKKKLVGVSCASGVFRKYVTLQRGGINKRRYGPNFLEIVRFSEILMLRRKIFGLLLLVKMKGSNFIGESLNMAHPTLQVPRRPWYQLKCDKSLHRGRGQNKNIVRYVASE